MKKNTKNSSYLAAIFCLYIFTAISVQAEVKSTMILNFDPAISGGTPSLHLQPNPAVSNNDNYTLRITAYAIDGTEETILETKTVSASENLRYTLPDRNKKEILGVRVEKPDGANWKLIAEWRALYSNGESLLTYAGTKKLQRPVDFTEFWNKARQNLKRIPMNPPFRPRTRPRFPQCRRLQGYHRFLR